MINPRIVVTEDLHTRLKIAAAKKHVSVKELAETILSEALDKLENERVP